MPQAAPRAAGQTQPAVRGEAQGEGRKTAGPPTPAPRPGPHLQGGDMLIVELVLAVAQHQRGFAHAALPEQHHLEGEAAAPGRRAGPRRHPRPAAEPRLTSTGRTAAPPPPTGTRARRGEGPAGMGRHRRGRGDRGWRETRQQNVPGGRSPAAPNGGFFLLRHAPPGHAQPPPPMGGGEAAAVGGPALSATAGRV